MAARSVIPSCTAFEGCKDSDKGAISPPAISPCLEQLQGMFELGRKAAPAFFERGMPWPSEQRCSEVLALARSVDPTLWGADEALGFFHQYLQRPDKAAVIASLRKIERNDLLPATQLYTEPYMVDFLVQNTLGRLFYRMRGGKTDLPASWRYFVPPRLEERLADSAWLEERLADSARPEERLADCAWVDPPSARLPTSVSDIVVLDPACGTGNFLVAAYDLLFQMYREEALVAPADIGRTILERNLFGIDIDEEALAIARLSLAMRGYSPGLPMPSVTNLVLVEGPPGEREPGPGELGSLLGPEQAHAMANPEAARVLGRSYDVVLCNPPYVGFRKLGKGLLRWIARHYPRATMDLYVAFIERCRELLAPHGLVGMVTPSSWLTSTKTVELRRAIVEEEPLFTVSLGQQSFEGAPLLYVSLFVAGREHRSTQPFTVVRCEAPPGPRTLRDSLPRATSWDRQLIEALPTCPLLPTAAPALIRALRSGTPVGDTFTTKDGLWTGKRDRDVRFFWEIDPADDRYVPLSGGKGYRRWFGAEQLRIDRRLVDKHRGEPRGAHAWEYARVAGGKLSARRAQPDTVAMAGVVSLSMKSTLYACASAEQSNLLGAVMNSRLGTAFLRSLVSGLNFNPGYCKRIPLPSHPDPSRVATISVLVERCVALQRMRDALDPSTDVFEVPDPGGRQPFADWVEQGVRREMDIALASLLIEARIERELFALYDVDEGSRLVLDAEVGPLVTDHPLVAGEETISERVLELLPGDVVPTSDEHPRVALSPEDLDRLERAIALGSSHSVASDDAGSDGPRSAARPLPADHELEALARKHALHPVSMARLVERCGKHSRAARTRLAETYLGVLLCRIFGFAWPTETAPRGHGLEEPLRFSVLFPEAVAVPDASVEQRSELVQRIRRVLANDFAPPADGEFVERDLELALGMSIGEWLERRFFDWQLGVFRSRPIVWQLHAPDRPRGEPARRGRRSMSSSVLVFGRALDAELLSRIQRSLLAVAEQTDPDSARTIRALADGIEAVRKGEDGLHIEVPWGASGGTIRPYAPNPADGVLVNIAPFHRAGMVRLGRSSSVSKAASKPASLDHGAIEPS